MFSSRWLHRGPLVIYNATDTNQIRIFISASCVDQRRIHQTLEWVFPFGRSWQGSEKICHPKTLKRHGSRFLCTKVNKKNAEYLCMIWAAACSTPQIYIKWPSTDISFELTKQHETTPNAQAFLVSFSVLFALIRKWFSVSVWYQLSWVDFVPKNMRELDACNVRHFINATG